MQVLTPYQVATIRILSAGIVLLPFALRAIKHIPPNKLFTVLLSGLVGSFFPAYFFCIAETKLNSSLAGILNALTPLFTVFVGIIFFNLNAGARKIIGVLIGFAGLVLLFVSNGKVDFKNASFTFLILLATCMYGFNVNMVGKYLKEIGSFNIVTIAFSLLIIPCLIILYSTGYFKLIGNNTSFIESSVASVILGIFGTAIASILFYILLKRAGALFASMVTYGIPFIAVAWGVYYGEKINIYQLLSLAVILLGVYLANTNKNPLSFFIKKG